MIVHLNGCQRVLGRFFYLIRLETKISKSHAFIICIALHFFKLKSSDTCIKMFVVLTIDVMVCCNELNEKYILTTNKSGPF